MGCFAAVCLVLGAVWEPAFHHQREQALQVLGILLLAAWAWISGRLQQEDRKWAERVFFVIFLAVACAMALFPHLLRPPSEFSPAYRGITRWRGWTVDPNNSGVVLGLAAVIALRLRREVSLRYSSLLLTAAGLCTLQMVRSFSRIGALSAALALLVWLENDWKLLDRRWRNSINWGVLVSLVGLPLAATSLRSSQCLPLRRLASVSNVMDLSWANRLYVLPGTLQAAFDRPWTGWGWGEVLRLHRKVYCPTFLKESTALLLNDFALLAASYGLPLLLAVAVAIGWCLLRGKNSPARMIVAGLSAAMFFQGVVRIPITFVPMCMAVGIVLGEDPPWGRPAVSWSGTPILAGGCLLGFLTAWCFLPLLFTNAVSYDGKQLIVAPRGGTPLTICLVTRGDLEDHGREAMSLASLGARAIVLHPEQVPNAEREYGTNLWLVDFSPGANRVSPKLTEGKTATERAIKTIHAVYDAGANEVPPAPDKPFPLPVVLMTLYACALAFSVRGCCVASSKPALAGCVAGLISLLGFAGFSRPVNWREENREVANWSRQMRMVSMPEEIYMEYVLNPEIAPNFSLRHRREVWHTFYQTSNVQSQQRLLEQLKNDIEIQILIRPDRSATVRSFEEIWRTRTCNLTERWYVLVATLRTLNVPARLCEGKAEMWLEGAWVPTGPGP